MIYPENADVKAEESTPRVLEYAFRVIHGHLLAQFGELTRIDADPTYLKHAQEAFHELNAVSNTIEFIGATLDVERADDE